MKTALEVAKDIFAKEATGEGIQGIVEDFIKTARTATHRQGNFTVTTMTAGNVTVVGATKRNKTDPIKPKLAHMQSLARAVHLLIKQVTEDPGGFQFATKLEEEFKHFQRARSV
jgi:hypothetical protein